MLIYVAEVTPRMAYVFQHIFKNEFDLEYSFTTDKSAFENYSSPKINYSEDRISDELFINAHPFLFNKSLGQKKIFPAKKYGATILFNTETACDIGFDIFAAVFYVLSRYEEYQDFTPDAFGRFPAIQSEAFKQGFLQFPVADIWINILKEHLQKKYPSLQFKQSKFNCILTYDIDVAYQYCGRNIFRNGAAMIKDAINFKFYEIYKRISTLAGITNDPWDVYDQLKEVLSKNNFKSIFFFLLADKGKYDRNLGYQSTKMKELVNEISSFSEMGIHPSFASFFKPQNIVKEKIRLDKLLGKKIIKSRQHYLKISLPHTYQNLIKAGITEDYSMCYADMPGFRAGTCKPFYFYDLQNEKVTSLQIFPVTFMDGTFIQYMKSSPKEALQNVYFLIQQIKNVNGTFISIWHNHTISKTKLYKDWSMVHNKMIEKLIFISQSSPVRNENS